MSTNRKETSPTVASLASQVLRDPHASAIQKQLAGSALAQANTGKQTGAEMEGVASHALSSEKYNGLTKTLAGSVTSQANKQRTR